MGLWGGESQSEEREKGSSMRLGQCRTLKRKLAQKDAEERQEKVKDRLINFMVPQSLAGFTSIPL